MIRKQKYWMVCDRQVCLYDSEKAGDRCVKHGAILTYRSWLNSKSLTRSEARKMLDEHRNSEQRWCLREFERNA